MIWIPIIIKSGSAVVAIKPKYADACSIIMSGSFNNTKVCCTILIEFTQVLLSYKIKKAMRTRFSPLSNITI
jgi:hypothetical protein